MDQQSCWADTAAFVSSLRRLHDFVIISTSGSPFRSHDLLSMFFLLCFYELSALPPAVEPPSFSPSFLYERIPSFTCLCASSSSSFVSLAALEKLPPPAGVTLQKVTQQQLPNGVNQSQPAAFFLRLRVNLAVPRRRTINLNAGGRTGGRSAGGRTSKRANERLLMSTETRFR